MNEHRGRVPATMLGVGWAFDVLAGRSKVAPAWIQNIGMQWLLPTRVESTKALVAVPENQSTFCRANTAATFDHKVHRELNPT